MEDLQIEYLNIKSPLLDFKCQQYLLKMDIENAGVWHLNVSIWHLKIQHLAFKNLAFGI